MTFPFEIGLFFRDIHGFSGKVNLKASMTLFFSPHEFFSPFVFPLGGCSGRFGIFFVGWLDAQRARTALGSYPCKKCQDQEA